MGQPHFKAYKMFIILLTILMMSFSVESAPRGKRGDRGDQIRRPSHQDRVSQSTLQKRSPEMYFDQIRLPASEDYAYDASGDYAYEFSGASLYQGSECQEK